MPSSPSPPQPISVLFVCLGNICRSTMAEATLRSLVSAPSSPYAALIARIDSSGTGAYHVGSAPDSRTMATLRGRGVVDYVHAARKVKGRDFEEFDYVFAMDGENLRDLQRLHQRTGGGGKAKVMLFGEFSGSTSEPEEVDDPYYGGRDGFEVAYEQCARFAGNFLREVFPGVRENSEEA